MHPTPPLLPSPLPAALRPAAPAPDLRLLPPAGRLLVAALRAGRADLRAGLPWEESELLALCDAAGLRRCAAARLGACAAFLLREAAAALGAPVHPTSGPAAQGSAVPVPAAPGARPAPAPLRPPGGAPGPTAAEAVLAAAVAAPPAPRLAARRVVAGWLPPRRRIPGLVLLDLVAGDLAAWPAAAAAGEPR